MKMLAVSLLVCSVVALTRALSLPRTDYPLPETTVPLATEEPTFIVDWLPTCPHGWSSFDTHCVVYVPEKKSLHEAEADCLSMGHAMPGFLASVTEARSPEEIHSMMKKAGQEQGQVWVRDPQSEQSSSWLWFFWSYNHGDNFDNFCHQGSAKQENQCLVLNFEGSNAGCLDYVPCDTKLPSICSSILMLEISIISAMKTLPLIAIVCVVLTLTGADARRCMIKRSRYCPGWSRYKGRYFIYIPTPMTWASAEKNCQSLGGNLASVRNIFEYRVIQRLILRRTRTYRETWIGGSDCQQEGLWLWSDGTRFHYSNWCRGEPNNGQRTQHCLQMNYGASKCWDDLQCNVHRPSVCAKKIR
ncbi:lymphocyte antigen 75-like [Mugil cephalus]|uniref:lymphocyte antigen 75-like n=1 Tax=Mugil cephalus TaxID=48193 RepID=UPI001FB80CED|nr:lymphocyte antigen 75-like [Mugil cephalus]